MSMMTSNLKRKYVQKFTLRISQHMKILYQVKKNTLLTRFVNRIERFSFAERVVSIISSGASDFSLLLCCSDGIMTDFQNI